MKLVRAILLRFAYGLVSLVFISFVTFLAEEVAPGDAALIIAGEKARPEDITRIRHELKLDRPWYERYVSFLTDACHLDFGRSYFGTREPVIDILKRNAPMTMKIASLAITLAALIGLTLGTIAGVTSERWQDKVVLGVSTLGVTVPNFVLAPVLVYFFALQLDYLPQTWEVNRVAPDYYYLILPVIVLAMRPMAMITRLTRASMIDTLGQEFIKTAVAKGVPRMRLILRHALRNAILPVITGIGTSFGFLLTGSFVVERFFTLPGLGREAIEAIRQGNTPVLQACILLTGMMFVTINLLVDMLQPILDPRIREAQI